MNTQLVESRVGELAILAIKGGCFGFLSAEPILYSLEVKSL